MTASTASLPGGHAGAPGDPLGPLTGAAARLVAAAEELLAAPASELDPVSSLQRTEAVVRVRAVLRAVELDGIRDADTRELYALREAGSVRTWLGALPAAPRSPTTSSRGTSAVTRR